MTGGESNTGVWRSVGLVGSDNAMGDALILQQRHTEDGLPTEDHRVVPVGNLVGDFDE